MNEASSGWWWWWWRRWWWSVDDGLKVGGVVEIGLRGKYLCAPTARNPAQGLVPSGGFRRRRKNAPQGSQPAQSWLSHRLKFAAGKRASHRIASHDASPTLSGFYRLFLFRMKKLNIKWNFFALRCLLAEWRTKPYRTEPELWERPKKISHGSTTRSWLGIGSTPTKTTTASRRG